MLYRPLALGLVAVATGCAAGQPDAQLLARARREVLSSERCPQRYIIRENTPELRFLVVGCNYLVQLKVECNDDNCDAIPERYESFEQPVRLHTTDGKSWKRPGYDPPQPGPAEDAQSTTSKTAVVTAGRRITDINKPAHKPKLPRDLAQVGTVVWGLYKVCVSNAGDVEAVSVVTSALPGGFDGAWVAKIETWKYQPYLVDGRPVAFCHPARIEVRSTY